MRGVITMSEVVAYRNLVWREFGARCFFRCIVACLLRSRRTFLDIVWETQVP
jgi:hypothetical protein